LPDRLVVDVPIVQGGGHRCDAATVLLEQASAGDDDMVERRLRQPALQDADQSSQLPWIPAGGLSSGEAAQQRLDDLLVGHVVNVPSSGSHL
jgi:hypothetical protein